MARVVRGPWTKYTKVQLECKDKSLTKQSDSKDADVNLIMKKALKNGQLPDPDKVARYEDLSSGQDFMDSMAIVLRAEGLFQELPSELRQELHNDPAKFLDWAANPENDQRMIDLGLKNVRRDDYDQSGSPSGPQSGQGSSGEASSQPAQESNPVSGESTG